MKIKHCLTVLVALLLFPVFSGAAGLKLAAPFGAEMVLQRNIAVPVWGWASPGSEVTVEFAGQKKSVTADAKGEWRVELASLAVSAVNRDFVVKSGEETISLANVLVGDVWICSGQSNMEWGITHGVIGGMEEANAADFPLIRLRTGNKVKSPVPLTEFNGSVWKICTPETLKTIKRNNGFSAVGFLFGKEIFKKYNVPVGLIDVSWGGTRIEPWTPSAGFQSVAAKNPGLGKLAAPMRKEQKVSHDTPTALYNAIINPLVPFAIRGAIWYQGESNLGETDYADKMAALVQGWRAVWNQGDFPFFYVQIAPYRYNKNNNPYLLPITWEQQTQALAIPNTGMAVITDIGNLGDIHPRNKHDVAARLFRLAASRTYGTKFVDDTGPAFKAVRTDIPGRKVIVEFDNVASGLKTRDGKAPSHFEIAGRDGIFHPAEAVIRGKTVVLSCEELVSPRQVRFAWHETSEPNLMNGEGLPAAPFSVRK